MKKAREEKHLKIFWMVPHVKLDPRKLWLHGERQRKNWNRRNKVQTHTHVCWVWCQCRMSCSITLCLFPLAQGLTEPGARLAVNQPQIFLSLPSKCWGYEHTYIHTQLFTYILWSELRFLCLHRKWFCPLSHPSTWNIHTFFKEYWGQACREKKKEKRQI